MNGFELHRHLRRVRALPGAVALSDTLKWRHYAAHRWRHIARSVTSGAALMPLIRHLRNPSGVIQTNLRDQASGFSG